MLFRLFLSGLSQILLGKILSKAAGISFLNILLIIILIYYGIPNLFKYRAEFLPPLPVEIINISDRTSAPKINFKKSPDTGKNKTNYVHL